ncbi:MAG: pyruvate, water dikinase regulatory protein [Myxococcota bacterium]|nr:pyruvate, water dikinase regulatory protein [Myxococcota bacterium]
MERPTIFVVSDSTGETAERVVRAALLQFPDQRVRIRLFTRVRDPEAVAEVLKKANDAGAMVVFTLVSPDLREYFHEVAAQEHIESVDVIGQLIHKVANYLEATPLNRPTATMPLSEEYFRRVEAIEFAVKSDDGKEPRNLRKADLVLTGVSRTSKTPLSTYLAGRGLKVANVPLVLGVPPPPELEEVAPEKVIGLTLAIEKLLEIRKARLIQLGMPADANYGLREHVAAELEYADEIFNSHPGWMVIDVSGRAIEETATIILEALKDREDLPTMASSIVI